MRLVTFCVAVLFSVTACTSSSNLLGSWNSKDSAPRKYHKLYVMALFPNMETRVAAEEAIAEALNAKGIRARVSHDEFPMVGKVDELMGMARDSSMIENLKQGFREKVAKKGADGLMMISAYDVQKVKEYHSGGPSITVAGPAYGYYPNGYNSEAASFGHGTYYDYYGYQVATVQSKGYYTTSATYFLQTNIYDVGTEQLIYAAQSKTVNYKDLGDEAAKLASIIADDVAEKGVLFTAQ